MTSPPVYAYRRGPKSPTKRAQPELSLQIAVAQYLRYALPPDCIFTASMAGAKMGMKTAAQAKAAGQSKGWPDIMILPPDGVTLYAELKSDKGTMTAEQIMFRNHCWSSGRTMWTLVRSVEDMETALKAWGIAPKCSIGAANRYSVNLPYQFVEQIEEK